MRKISLVLLFPFTVVMAFSQANKKYIVIIPEPVSLVKDTGNFVLPPQILIQTSENADAKSIGIELSSRLSVPTGYQSTVNAKDSKSTIQLLLNAKPEASLGNEGYTLKISPSSVNITANKPAGLFYGVQTLFQLLPKEIESRSLVQNVSWQVPCVTITDYPRFGWRGIMFDVSRHFFTKQEVMDFVDQMAKYKFNLLHLHLTDDEGWRVEIKSLPKLTEVGAWNVRRTGTFGSFSAPSADEPRNYGGFYTQEDIKELVRYAQGRYINILPEVDVPGHSLSAIASYPELSCTPGADQYRVRSGEKIMDWHDGGFTALVDNTLCPANEKVYAFLDKVFAELAQLFPFEYIHVGGDECAKNFWENSSEIKSLMQKQGLKNMDEVQSYFEKRIGKLVESKGKKLIGWDEILEGGLAPNAVVMSWRGLEGGIKAAKMGHEVVMSPTTFAYLDYMQGDRAIEPPVYSTLRLKTAYSFEPVPEGVDKRFIKGGQCNLWTEQVYNTRHLQYMVWPRSLAIAECLWSQKEQKNWNNFAKKVEVTFDRMDIEQVKYSRAMFDPIFRSYKDQKDSLQVELSTEVEGLDIYYSFDNSHPDNFYPKYSGDLSIPKGASTLKVISYRGGKPLGRQIDMPVKELRSRANKNRK